MDHGASAAAAVDRERDRDAPADEADEIESLPLLDDDGLRALLARSTRDVPLSRAEIRHAERSLKSLLGQRGLSRAATGTIRERLAAATRHRQDYDHQYTGRRRQPRVARGGVPAAATYRDDESEVSSQEADADERLGRAPMAMAPTSGRSHVYGYDHPDPELRRYATGLPHADTYLMLLLDGHMVPRTINDAPNHDAHRKTVSRVERAISEHVAQRDVLVRRYWRLLDQQQSAHGASLRRIQQEAEALKAEIDSFFYTRIRPHVEQILFGSSTPLFNEDIEASEGATADRARIDQTQRRNAEDPSAAASLSRARRLGGRGPTPSGPEGSHTHAEQTLLQSKLWMSIINRLSGSILEHAGNPRALAAQDGRRIKLLLNRSTCIGCGRELMLELIRFWTTIAARLRLPDWRAAQARFGRFVRFEIATPAIYERGAERNTDYANFDRIVRGLLDAGWIIDVNAGISPNPASDEKNAEMRERVSALAGVPSFHAADFAYPAAITLPDPLEARKTIRVNGADYVVDESGRVAVRAGAEPSARPTVVGALTPLGAAPAVPRHEGRASGSAPSRRHRSAAAAAAPREDTREQRSRSDSDSMGRSSDRRLTFEQWMERLEEIVQDRMGVPLTDLPDEDFREGHEQGDTPLAFFEERMDF